MTKKIVRITLSLIITLSLMSSTVGSITASNKGNSRQNVHLTVPKKLRGSYYQFNKTKSFPKGYFFVRTFNKNWINQASMKLNGQETFSGVIDKDFYLIGKAKGNLFRLGHFNSGNSLPIKDNSEDVIRIHKIKYKGKWIKAISIRNQNKKTANVFFKKKLKQKWTTTSVKYKLNWNDTKKAK